MALFMMALTSTAHYLLTGTPPCQLEHVGSLTAATPQLNTAIASLLEVLQGLSTVGFEIERRSRRPPETSDEDI